MEIRIFKRLLAFIAVLTISAQAFAQDTLPAPPLPPENYKLNKEYKHNKEFKTNKEYKFNTEFKLNKNFDKVAFKKNMVKFNLKMADLHKQMFVMNSKINTQVFVKMKDFDKKFNAKFKDFGKDFSGSFNGMVPDVDVVINNNTSRNVSDKEYKKQIASGEITEKVKNYSKSYSVDGNDILQINNKFGKVTVNTWNKSEFKVDVQMKFSSNNEEAVNDLIEGSSISDSKTGNVVSFRTNLANGRSQSGGNNQQRIDINYTVYMPAGNAIDINNQFGAVILPDLSGKATIKVQFGNLIAQHLSNTQNDITINFTQGNTSTIEVFNGGKLKVQYSKFKVGILNNVDASFGFSSIDIDRLKGSADVSVKYGNGINVASIDKSVKNINIHSQFAKVNLDFKDSDDFTFDVTSKMGGFDNNSSKVKVTSKSPSDEDRGWSSTKNYKGYIGKDNGDSKIVINATFGRVSFN
ncbi:hypothetical protein [Mucilaginibacter sp.]|jgi:hypothetical protein|uniref:hypothetical protein n=1 Tax=Mucilaginibacter sp. TaxID=1882438 RepID=UPI003561A320